MYTVNVLPPNGRRQQVKVTPNTTILQILEEVCMKHGFNPKDYDLRHHNKILDVSAMIRFTSLPNNAQLEMTENVKPRQESPVTLGLQFETGERLTGVFSPSESIWNVIINVKPEEKVSDNLVVIYMRQEIYGIENLMRTTLRSLGLTSGRAMLRILHKSPEELHNQANVSTVIPSRGSAISNSDELISPEPSGKGKGKEKSKSPPPKITSQKTPPPEPIRKEPKYTNTTLLRGNIFEQIIKEEKEKLKRDGSKTSDLDKISMRSNETAKKDTRMKSYTEFKDKTSTVPTSMRTPTIEEEEVQESKIIILGERNAVAFNLNNVKPTVFEEESDDFFDLTINDAKLLLKQARQLRSDLENAPLMTSAQREFEKDKKVLALLHQYKKTVLRVNFPDRTVLQGTFFSLETVSAVEKFVSEYLHSPKLRFYLYTTPPKVILKSDSRLIECGCVPSCVLYFGLPPDVPPPSQYLKTEVLQKLSTPSAAALHAYETRGADRKIVNDSFDMSENSEFDQLRYSKDVSNSEAGPSGSQEWDTTPRTQESSPYFRLPKWFRSDKN